MARDIEAQFISWLAECVEVSVSADVPNPRPLSFITVERTGGARASVVRDTPTLAVQCWAATRSQASALALTVDDLLPLFAFEPGIGRVARNSLIHFPDLEGKVARYQLVVDIICTTN
jgi:hypothetical protein